MGWFQICCSVANIVAALWGYFYPRPYGFCITVLILLPLLPVLAARLVRRRDVLAYTALGPIIALAACAYDFEFSAVSRLAVLSCAVGAVFVAAVFLADRGVWRTYGVALIAGCLIYGFGAAGELNVLLDASGTKHLAVPILNRDSHIGRHSTFEVVLGPWGEVSRSNKHSVSWGTYLALRHQTVACVDLGRGALGVPWFRISACEGLMAAQALDGLALPTTSRRLRYCRRRTRVAGTLLKRPALFSTRPGDARAARIRAVRSGR
jgi:hypothetical protein